MTPTLATGQIQVIATPATQALREYSRLLADRAAKIRAGLVHPADDNLLKITSDGRKASVFNGPPNSWPAYPNRTKLTDCAMRVWQHYVAADRQHGTQLVFCDLYTPKLGDTTDADYYAPTLTEDELFEQLGVYGKLKAMLTAQGVPPDEVAFAHDYRTPRLRAQLHESLRRGDVRVCIGSTGLIGQAGCPGGADPRLMRGEAESAQSLAGLYERQYLHALALSAIWRVQRCVAR